MKTRIGCGKSPKLNLAAHMKSPGLRVHEAAVFGVPHERLGEEVAVAILVNEGKTLSAEELWVHLDGKIASFKVPSKVVFMSEPLPRNAAGKFLKRELRERVGSGELSVSSR